MEVSSHLSDNIDFVNEYFIEVGLAPIGKYIEDEEKPKPINIKNSLDGKIIAIYSLDEKSITRAANQIKERLPGVEVYTNSDKVSTGALVALTQKADIFLFVTGKAKHQAFYTVKDNMPSKAELVYPQGNGTASIVRKILSLAN